MIVLYVLLILLTMLGILVSIVMGILCLAADGDGAVMFLLAILLTAGFMWGAGAIEEKYLSTEITTVETVTVETVETVEVSQEEN